jgi:hypothetical protein
MARTISVALLMLSAQVLGRNDRDGDAHVVELLFAALRGHHDIAGAGFALGRDGRGIGRGGLRVGQARHQHRCGKGSGVQRQCLQPADGVRAGIARVEMDLLIQAKARVHQVTHDSFLKPAPRCGGTITCTRIVHQERRCSKT